MTRQNTDVPTVALHNLHPNQWWFSYLDACAFLCGHQRVEQFGGFSEARSLDMRLVDEVIGYDLDPLCGNIGQVVTVLVASASFSFYQAPLVGLLFYLFFRIMIPGQIPSTKDLQNISSAAESSFIQSVSALATPDGITSVRAYGLTDRYVHDFNKVKDEKTSASWHSGLYKSMMNLRLEALGAMYVVMSGIFLVSAGGDAATAGVALSFASTLSSAVVRGLQRIVNMDSSLKKIEKLVLYDDIEQERVAGLEVPSSWLGRGEIEVAKFSAGYGPNLPATLKNVSFTVKLGERIGVVGRTGAGKSTLALAFAELVQKRARTIHIDSVDNSEVKLETLRTKILITPQDPYLFGGSLRRTIDPGNHHTDDDLLAALRKYGLLATAIQAETQGALDPCQRQIDCLIKSMLSKKKFVIMDEATSAVDMETDSAIQTAIRKGLRDATDMVIAHRLATYAHLDKVLVMHDDKVTEFGPLGDLFRQKGQFWAVVDHSADREDLVKRFSAVE
ncbi:hypothetical protein PWT90_01811 [Aphanocladium album]|nr:hypothetical protein PWT90_01811 [Aphanocladium album]